MRDPPTEVDLFQASRTVEPLAEYLQRFSLEDLERFRQMLPTLGWRLFWGALVALERTAAEEITSADSPQEAFSRKDHLVGIRKVIGLIETILNRGESNVEQGTDFEDPAEGFGGSATGWVGFGDPLGTKPSREWRDKRDAAGV